MAEKRFKPGILISYAYIEKQKGLFSKLLSYDPNSYTFFLDCGAYSAWNCGMKINLKDFALFVRDMPKLPGMIISQLDVVYSPEKTRDNFFRLLDMGLDVKPVITAGTTEEEILELAPYSDYFLVGGVWAMVNSLRDTSYLGKIKQLLPGKKIHWFGYTNLKAIKTYRPASVDSSSIDGCYRFGTIEFFLNAHKIGLTRKNAQNPIDYRIVKHLLKIGFTVDEIKKLSKWESWSYKDKERTLLRMSCASRLHAGYFMQKNCGTIYFQSILVPKVLQTIFETVEFLEEHFNENVL